ncbi:MAG: hypothetical protein KBC57_07935 [Neisseriaceae bacterium]|nr:hypothetical protein [Neisseriaceae bacterium]
MIGLNPPRWILFSSLILAACGVSNSQRLQPLTPAAASNEVALPPDPWPLGPPMASMVAGPEDQVQPDRSGAALTPERARPRSQNAVLARPTSPTAVSEPLSSFTAADVASALVAQAEAPLVLTPPVVSLSPNTLSRTLSPTGLLSSLWPSVPVVPTVPVDATTLVAILPALPSRLRPRRVYVGTISGQEQADSNLVLALDATGDRLYGRYELPLAERTTEWMGFEFVAAVTGSAFVGEGVFLSEDDAHEVVALTVAGELSADQQQVTGHYEVVGESQLQGTFTARQYAFAEHDDWHDEAVATVPLETMVAPKAEPVAGFAPAVVWPEEQAEADVTADANTDTDADQAPAQAQASEPTVTIITLPPPKSSAYRDMDFLFAFPAVPGRFESDVYRFGGFEQAKVVALHAWAASAQDDPNDLTYFMEAGHLVGSRYGRLLPWYRVELLA